MNVDAFWKATQQLLAAAIPNRVIGLTLRHNLILPVFARWTSPMPDGFFATEPLKSHIAERRRKKIVRIGDLFPDRSRFIKSRLYRRYLAPQECTSVACLLFRERERLIAPLRSCATCPRAICYRGNKNARTALPAVFGCTSASQIARARTRGAHGPPQL